MTCSSTFRAIFKATLKSPDGYTSTGRPAYGSETVIKYMPVYMKTDIAPTSIRTDKSGSKSRADEIVFQGRILVDPNYSISPNDLILIDGNEYQVMGVFPRYEMHGPLHHYQVDLVMYNKLA